MFQIILLEDQQFHHFVEVVTFNLLKLNKIIIIKSLTMKIHFLKKIIKTKQKDKIYLRKIIKMRIQLLIIIFIIYIIIIFQVFQLIMILIQIQGHKFQQKNHHQLNQMNFEIFLFFQKEKLKMFMDRIPFLNLNSSFNGNSTKN